MDELKDRDLYRDSLDKDARDAHKQYYYEHLSQNEREGIPSGTDRPTKDNQFVTTTMGNTITTVTQEDHTATVDVGGIDEGDTFLAATPLDDILSALLSPASISTLSYTGYAALKEVNDDIVNPVMTWAVKGSPADLTIADNQGFLSGNHASGTTYPVTHTYNILMPGDLIWTLSGSNVDDITCTVTYVFATYNGSNTTGVIPTDLEILAGTKTIKTTSSGITINPNTTAVDYGWFAVEQSQTGGDYTTWYITALNNGSIGSGDFISKKGTVVVSGETYDVYMYNYPSEVTSNITLQ